jgi:hypothetical protein
MLLNVLAGPSLLHQTLHYAKQKVGEDRNFSTPTKGKKMKN